MKACFSFPQSNSVHVEALYQQLPRLWQAAKWWQRVRLEPENQFGVVIHVEAKPWVQWAVGWFFCFALRRVTVSARALDRNPPKPPRLSSDVPYCVLIDCSEESWRFSDPFLAAFQVLSLV